MNCNSTYIRTLYSPGYSFLMMSFYKTNLSLGFTAYQGTDNLGRSKYDKSKFLSTTIDYEKAAALSSVAASILDGKARALELTMQCGNNASLIFKYEPDENNQMSTYLMINKNNQTIPHKFGTHQYRTKENGQVVIKTIQTGLGVFAATLEGYLTGIGADLHLSKLSEEDLKNSQMDY